MPKRTDNDDGQSIIADSLPFVPDEPMTATFLKFYLIQVLEQSFVIEITYKNLP